VILPRQPGQRTQLRRSRQHFTLPLPRRDKQGAATLRGEPACCQPRYNPTHACTAAGQMTRQPTALGPTIHEPTHAFLFVSLFLCAPSQDAILLSSHFAPRLPSPLAPAASPAQPEFRNPSTLFACFTLSPTRHTLRDALLQPPLARPGLATRQARPASTPASPPSRAAPPGHVPDPLAYRLPTRTGQPHTPHLRQASDAPPAGSRGGPALA
jgi:hypothetical protein